MVRSRGGYGVTRASNNCQEDPTLVLLTNNVITDNNGQVIEGQSSADVGNICALIDGLDTGNTIGS